MTTHELGYDEEGDFLRDDAIAHQSTDLLQERLAFEAEDAHGNERPLDTIDLCATCGRDKESDPWDRLCPDCAPSLRERIRTAVALLATARAGLTMTKSLLKERKAQFEAENATLLKNEKTLAADVGGLEAQLRLLGVESFQADGEKKPVRGIEVKEVTVYHYRDEDALAFCKEKQLGVVESFDRATFEAVAASVKPPFFSIVKEPKVTIATKLDHLIGDVK